MSFLVRSWFLKIKLAEIIDIQALGDKFYVLSCKF